MCAISSLTSTFAISSPDEFLFFLLIEDFWQDISYRKHCNERRPNMLRKLCPRPRWVSSRSSPRPLSRFGTGIPLLIPHYLNAFGILIFCASTLPQPPIFIPKLCHCWQSACDVWHSSITAEQRDQLEVIQRQAVRIIFGHELDFDILAIVYDITL